jgi:hypothetical protein
MANNNKMTAREEQLNFTCQNCWTVTSIQDLENERFVSYDKSLHELYQAVDDGTINDVYNGTKITAYATLSKLQSKEPLG